MEPEARYTIVGAIVLGLAAMLTATVVWLHRSGDGGALREYAIYFLHQSVEGLAPRSPVTMRGIQIGTVTGLRFAPGRPDTVEVVIAASPAAPVLDSTRATIGRNLFTGLASVQLANTGRQGRPIAPAPPGMPVPVIAEGESAEQQTLARLGELAQRANQALSPENQAAFAHILANMQRVSAHADQSLSKVDTALDSLDRTTRSVGTLANAVAKDGRALASRYDELGAQSTAAMRDASDAIRRASSDLNRVSQRVDTVLGTGGTDLQTTTQTLRDAADSIATAADRLHEPGEIIRGPAPGNLGPGEGKR
jgi:phospholipid/cholesterol/gamma-HCH transport system substrate-binding protein